MTKINKSKAKYLIAPIASLFTIVTIASTFGFATTDSMGSLNNTISKAKTKNAEAWDVLKSDDVKFAMGGFHSAAIVDKKLFMWGRNDYGQLGIENKINHDKPIYVDVDGDKNPNNDNILDVSLGNFHTSALTPSGIYIWGYNANGELGLGTSGSGTEKTTPQKVAIP
ncbi:MAG: hypothetical protein ACRC4M_02215, partial [Mycoplasma sp.]